MKSTKQHWEKRVIATNDVVLHIRPAAMLVKVAQRFDSSIRLSCGNMRVDAKSIMGILTLGSVKGCEVTLSAEGPDAHEAVHAIEQLFDSRFHNAPEPGQPEPNLYPDSYPPFHQMPRIC